MRPGQDGSIEYAIVDRTHTRSLADLRSLQDWYLRYQLATVPGVAEVATIGGYVRQYQVKLDPNKLLAYGIPVSTVIDRVRDSTNEVGGNVLEMNGAEYMVRGRGLPAVAIRSRECSGRNQERHAGPGARPGHGGLRAGRAPWRG